MLPNTLIMLICLKCSENIKDYSWIDCVKIDMMNSDISHDFVCNMCKKDYPKLMIQLKPDAPISAQWHYERLRQCITIKKPDYLKNT